MTQERLALLMRYLDRDVALRVLARAKEMTERGEMTEEELQVLNLQTFTKMRLHA